MKYPALRVIAVFVLAASCMSEDALGGAPAQKPQAQSIDLFRRARTLLREKKWDAARTAYRAVAALEGVPAHHRLEAEECLEEIDRLEAGRPARDPASLRTEPPRFPTPAITLHVASGGADSNPGSARRPFATLEGARNALRARKSHGPLLDGGAAVVVHDGEYRVTRSFQLKAEDSGTEAAPIVYRAAPGAAPRFRAGMRLSGLRPVEDAAVKERLPVEARESVVYLDLHRAGIDEVLPLRLGGFASGAGFRTWPVAELFLNGKALPLAGWPDKGFVRTGEVPETGRFRYEGDRPRRWKAEPDAWLYGYWYHDWADSYEKIASIDVERREIVLAPPHHRYRYRAGQRYRAINMLCELDSPGEWYLDRGNLRLYLWPPEDLSEAVIELSQGSFALVELTDVSHVSLVGLTWELGGADGLIVRGGERCLLAGCTVRQCGGNGIEVHGGTSHRVLSCDIASMGRGGAVVSGGDRRTLRRGGHVIENCHIRDLSRIDHTYTPGVRLEGVGNRIAHNLVHGIASSAFRIEGNDHLVELNEVFDVLLESDDQGGADMYGNATYRGDVFRWNWWHHIGNWRGTGEQSRCGHAGIRLDDAICGVLVYGNVFQKCSAGGHGFGAVQIHGGKENVIDANVFVDNTAAISFSPWGEQRWLQFIRDALDKGGIDRDLYVSRYPDLARLEEAHDRNHVWRNVVCRCETFLLRNRVEHDLIANWILPDAHAAAAAGPKTLAGTDSPACEAIGFRPIPIEEIGLYRDGFRSTLPDELLRRARAR